MSHRRLSHSGRRTTEQIWTQSRRSLGMSREAVVELHSGAEYTVAFMGFSPGFPYLIADEDRSRGGAFAGAAEVGDAADGGAGRLGRGGGGVLRDLSAELARRMESAGTHGRRAVRRRARAAGAARAGDAGAVRAGRFADDADRGDLAGGADDGAGSRPPGLGAHRRPALGRRRPAGAAACQPAGRKRRMAPRRWRRR